MIIFESSTSNNFLSPLIERLTGPLRTKPTKVGVCWGGGGVCQAKIYLIFQIFCYLPTNIFHLSRHNQKGSWESPPLPFSSEVLCVPCQRHFFLPLFTKATQIYCTRNYPNRLDPLRPPSKPRPSRFLVSPHRITRFLFLKCLKLENAVIDLPMTFSHSNNRKVISRLKH